MSPRMSADQIGEQIELLLKRATAICSEVRTGVEERCTTANVLVEIANGYTRYLEARKVR